VPPKLRAVTALDRPFLHAARLSLTHPSTGARLTFEAPLPPDLAGVLASLRQPPGPRAT
jgi:23S rRNA pseudouridine1911/1915/1917 synthase